MPQSQKNLPPGTFGLPVLGETIPFATSPNRFIDERQARYGNVFKTNILFSKTVYVLGAEGAAWIFAGENKYLQNKWAGSVRRLLGPNSLALLNGKDHLDRRRLLAPSYGYNTMRTFIPQMQALTQKHLSRHAGTEVDVVEIFRQMAFEIASTLILGGNSVDLPYLSKLFKVWTAGLFSPLPLNLPFLTYGKALKARQDMLAYLERHVAARRKTLAETDDDVLARLLRTPDANGSSLSDEAIAQEIQLQLFAGHDTTVTALSNLILMLANAQDVQTKLQQEAIAQPLEPTLESLRSMGYMMAVIHESMRIIPPITGAFRETLEDVEFNGYKIPKGWTIGLNMRSAHRQHTWSFPENFDPERFSPERAEHDKANSAFIPFGGGPRVCLGQHFAMVEMTVILSEMLRHFTWQVLPGQDFSYATLPFPLPQNGILISLQRI